MVSMRLRVLVFEGVGVTAVIALRMEHLGKTTGKHIVSTLTFFDKCDDLASHAVPFIIL